MTEEKDKKQTIKKYLQNSTYAIITPDKQKASDNSARRQKFKNILNQADLDFLPIEGKYAGNKEQSYLIPNISEQNAVNLADNFNQESFVYSDGERYRLIDANGNTIAEADSISFGEEAGGENYSIIDGVKFSIDFIFSENKLNEGVHGKLKQAVVYHGTFAKQNIEKIVEDGYDPGVGDYYGKGLYTVYDLEGSATARGHYGNYIVKFRIPITDEYLVFDPGKARQIYGDDASLRRQIQEIDGLNFRKGFIRQLERERDADIQSDAAKLLVKKIGKEKISQVLDGIIYTGRKDGKVLVCYNPADAQVLGWKEIGSYKEIDHNELEIRDTFEFHDEWQKNHPVYDRATAKVVDIYETREGNYNEFFFKWEDMLPLSMHKSMYEQLSNAEIGDIYEIKGKTLAYTGETRYERIEKPPFRQLSIEFIDRGTEKETNVIFQDGDNAGIKETTYSIYMTDPHIDTFRRTGRNALNMPGTSDEFKNKIKSAADDAFDTGDTGKQIEEAMNRMMLDWRLISEYMQPLKTRDKWYRKIGDYELPKEIEADPKPGFSRVAPPIQETKKQLQEQKEPKELQYFRRFVRQAKEYYDVVFQRKAYSDINKFLSTVIERADSIFETLTNSGLSRRVYHLDNDQVLKVATRRSGLEANLNESQNLLHTSYPDLFPKVHGRDEDGVWIVMEKVEVIMDNKTIIKQFPKFSTVYNLMQENGINISAYSFRRMILDELTDEYIKFKNISKMQYGHERAQSWYDDLEHMILMFSAPERDELPDKIVESMYDAIANPSNLFRNISLAFYEFDMRTNDLGPENVGFDKEGNFVILDTGH